SPARRSDDLEADGRPRRRQQGAAADAANSDDSELETIQDRPQHDAIGGRRRSFDAANLCASSGLGPLCQRHDFRAVTDDPIDGAYGPDQSNNPVDGAWGPD